MLIVSGTINGQFYDEQPIKATVLIDAFQVPPMNGDPKIFKLITGTTAMRKNRNKPGTFLVTPGRRISPEFTVTTSDGSVTIRYATKKTPIPGGGGTYRYEPKKMSFIKGEPVFWFGQNALEEYVWAYLHPDNKTSPFTRPNKPPVYTYSDPAAEAEKGRQELAQRMELMQVIMMMDEQELRQRAAGMAFTVNSQRIDYKTALSENINALRNRLIQHLTVYQTKFVDGWNSADDSVLGLLRVVERMGIIEVKGISGGGKEWRYANEYGGARIVTSNAKQNPWDILVNEIVSNYNHYVPKLRGLVDVNNGKGPPEAALRSAKPAPQETQAPVVVEKVVEKVVYVDRPVDKPEVKLSKDVLDSMNSVEFVSILVDNELVDVDRDKRQVVELNKKGASVRPLLKINNLKEWKAELSAYFSDEANKEERTAFTALVLKNK